MKSNSIDCAINPIDVNYKAVDYALEVWKRCRRPFWHLDFGLFFQIWSDYCEYSNARGRPGKNTCFFISNAQGKSNARADLKQQ